MTARGMLRWTDEQFIEDAAKRARWQKGGAIVNTEVPATANAPSKYHNEKTGEYASKKEAKRAAALHTLLAAGHIRNLREQVRYLLIPKYTNADGSCQERAAHYIADFVYDEAPTWNPVVEDCKGMRTDVYILKRKLMLMVHGIKILET